MDESVQFADAVTRCEVLGGDLAVPFDTAEHNFIMGLVTANLASGARLWLGDKALVDTFVLVMFLFRIERRSWYRRH